MSLFCKPVSSKRRFLPHRLLNQGFTFTLFPSVAAVPSSEWESLSGQSSIFLNPAYLSIVEKCTYTSMLCRYVIVYYNKKPCGIIYYQVITFKAGTLGDLVTAQFQNGQSKRLSMFEKYIESNRNEELLRLFTCGNNLISGDYGFVFSKDINQQTATELLLNITETIAREEKIRGAICAILIKDFHKPLEPSRLLDNEKYTRFAVEPNMVVEIPEGVKNKEEYIELFSKKYRNRAKTIFKSLAGLEFKELTLTEIQKHEKEIYSLYENIFDRARFKLTKLPEYYFSKVKAEFREQFKLTALFRESKILAFGSCFLMPDSDLEAHYIGFDYEVNNEYNLYQNLLYQMIESGIKNKCKCVNLGRTAAEIKTTVGAKPHELICYIKPQNTVSRVIQKPFIGMLQPAEWTPRNPFKEEPEEKRAGQKV